MKKNLFLILAIAFATTMSAQFYAGLGLGYGFGASKRANGVEYSGTNNSVETNIYGSYGQGLNIAPKLGFMFNENIGFELGASYLIGAKQTITKSQDRLEEASSSGLRLSPQLVLKLENGFYSRFGMIIPVMGQTIITDVDNKYDPTFTGSYMKKETTMETKGSFSMGFIGAIGYNYALSDNMNLFGELEYIGLSIKSGTAEFTQYDVDGKDQLVNMDTAQKEYEFVDEVDNSTTYNKDNPTKVLKQKAPFSSFGINIGVTFSF